MNFNQFKEKIEAEYPNTSWRFMDISEDIFKRKNIKLKDMFIASNRGSLNLTIHYNEICKPTPWSNSKRSYQTFNPNL
jgi:hypothetical protein